MLTFLKQPTETVTHAFSYVAALPIDATSLSSATLSAIDLDTGADATSDVLSSTTGEISTLKVLFTVTGGEDGNNYKITISTALNNGDTIEDDVLMKVRAI